MKSNSFKTALCILSFSIFILFSFQTTVYSQENNLQKTTEKKSLENRKAIETIVKEYLLENPDIIRQALRKTKVSDTQQPSMKNLNLLYKNTLSHKVGPEDAKVKIIEFFDYNCYYCKLSSKWISDIIEKHPDDVQIIFKELPLLEGRTHTSRMAAKAALSAGKQGKYLPFHYALMKNKKQKLSNKNLRKIARELGLKDQEFLKEMNNAIFTTHIDDNLKLAREIGVVGTPFFLINGKVIAGADQRAFNRLFNQELNKK